MSPEALTIHRQRRTAELDYQESHVVDEYPTSVDGSDRDVRLLKAYEVTPKPTTGSAQCDVPMLCTVRAAAEHPVAASPGLAPLASVASHCLL